MSTIPDPHTAKNDFIAKFQAPTWRQVDDPRPTSDRRRALVIAISYAPGIVPPQLSGTYADANNVILMLEKFGYQKSDICVLADIEIRTENAAGITPDKSRMPDRDNIFRAMVIFNITQPVTETDLVKAYSRVTYNSSPYNGVWDVFVKIIIGTSYPIPIIRNLSDACLVY
ncbi:unnamed protein product [Rhizoctonia solani]|uniref:Uncharacterized protein n=1 Tax=Rhizoctonia solani TaxID=456999 RepID=A0A8H3BVL7_9AGAM|nr:unnamed protein product [Rhizoctonia solani]